MAEPLFWDDVEPLFPQHGNLFSTFLHCRTLNCPFLCLTASLQQFHPKRSGSWCVSWWFIDSIVCIVSLGDGMIIFLACLFSYHVPIEFCWSIFAFFSLMFTTMCIVTVLWYVWFTFFSFFLCLVPDYSHCHWCFKSWCFKWKKKKKHIYEAK